MKVVAFNGSSRKDGNTASLIWMVFKELAAEDIDVEMIQLGDKPLFSCRGCGTCSRTPNRHCIITEDPVNEWLDKIMEADGMILASPVYFGDVSGQMKILIDRIGMLSGANPAAFRRKVGVGIAVGRRAGGLSAFHTLNNLFLLREMIVPGGSYWNVARGKLPGEVNDDEEGVRSMSTLGRNMAWLLKKLHAEPEK